VPQGSTLPPTPTLSLLGTGERPKQAGFLEGSTVTSISAGLGIYPTNLHLPNSHKSGGTWVRLKALGELSSRQGVWQVSQEKEKVSGSRRRDASGRARMPRVPAARPQDGGACGQGQP
jgi:hypothetical protein